LNQVTIEVGNLVCLFSFNDPGIIPEIRDRYEQFIVTKTPDIRFQVNVVDQLGSARGDAGYNPGFPNVRFEGSRIRYFREDFHVTYDPDHHACEVEMVQNLFGFDALFRVFYSIFLVRNEGFILHACALLRHERAYVFTGSEYAGKSAITMMTVEGNTPMTDELTVIRKEEGVFRAYGTPFWGEFHKGGANTGSEIQKFFFLEKSEQTAIEAMENPQKLKRVIGNILNFAADRHFYNQLLFTLMDFFNQVPAARLHCVPDEKIWEVIDEDARRATR